MKNYFTTEIQKRKPTNKKLREFIGSFDHFDKTLIVVSATSGGIPIISFASIIGALARIAKASFSVIFSLTTGIIKKLLK